ncbi:hypothetical protein ACP70R_013157 [Stipagrostis hirtigluma subsp. patula]
MSAEALWSVSFASTAGSTSTDLVFIFGSSLRCDVWIGRHLTGQRLAKLGWKEECQCKFAKMEIATSDRSADIKGVRLQLEISVLAMANWRSSDAGLLVASTAFDTPMASQRVNRPLK